MPIHLGKFPYEIRGRFKSQIEAYLAGWTACRTWAVFENDEAIGYAPPHHAAIQYVVTNEQHDCCTYYEQEKV